MPLIQTFLRQTEVNLWVQDLYSKMARIQEQEKKEEEEEEQEAQERRSRRNRPRTKEEAERGGPRGGGDKERDPFSFMSFFLIPPFLNQVFCLCVLQIHQSLWHSICKQRLAVDWLVLVESQAEVGQTDLKVESVIVGKHSQDLRKMQQRKMDVRWIFLAVTG